MSASQAGNGSVVGDPREEHVRSLFPDVRKGTFGAEARCPNHPCGARHRETVHFSPAWRITDCTGDCDPGEILGAAEKDREAEETRRRKHGRDRKGRQENGKNGHAHAVAIMQPRSR